MSPSAIVTMFMPANVSRFEQTGSVFLVAAESIQRLGQDHIESPAESIAHQRLEIRAEQGRAGTA